MPPETRHRRVRLRYALDYIMPSEGNSPGVSSDTFQTSELQMWFGQSSREFSLAGAYFRRRGSCHSYRTDREA